MKSAHRHQLETNVLADWLGHKLEELEPYKNAIAIGFFALMGIALVTVFAMSGNDPAAAQQWSTFYSAFATPDTASALATLVDKKDDNSPAALWARKVVADQDLASGCNLLFGNRKEAFEKLERAETLYSSVVAASQHPILTNTARLGLARTLESMDRIQDARKTYEEVIASGKDSAFAKIAEEGIRRLDDPREVAALAWFAEQTPALPANHPPLGNFPGLNSPLPDRPDLSFPGGAFNGDGTVKPETPQTPAPQPEPEAPAPSTPAPSTPAEVPATPAPAEAPAAPAPVEPAPATPPPAENK